MLHCDGNRAYCWTPIYVEAASSTLVRAASHAIADAGDHASRRSVDCLECSGISANLQRKKEIETVIQSEYQKVLAIAEKRIDERAYRMTEEIREKFPDADRPEDLEFFLTGHPNVSHAFIWNGKGQFEWQSQPGMMDDPEFRDESKSLSSDYRSVAGSGVRDLPLQS